MANYTWIDKCIPPDYVEILRDAVPINSQWYEIRNSHRLMSFPITEYSQAVMTGKNLNKIWPSTEFVYCWRSEYGIEEVKIY